MRRIVFYSWQSDLPNASNRGFIQQALESAASAIAADSSIAIEPVVDRDTQGVAGSPDISATIFGKITAADIFVADVSIVSRPETGRPTPNPNVLIELGYALKTLGPERIILVFNTSFGKIEELPFDLRMRRVTPYEMPAETEHRATERKKLEGQLNSAVRSALAVIPVVDNSNSLSLTLTAVETGQSNRIVLVRRTLDEIFKKLASLEPPKRSAGGTVDDLINAIDQTQDPIAEFSKIAESVAVINDLDLALDINRWFGRIFEQYYFSEHHTGTYTDADWDYFKFIGHELFVTFIAFMLREQRWSTLGRILEEPIPVQYMHHEQGPGTVSWDYASRHITLLLPESSKRGRMSLHADILRDRHTTGGLATILPLDDFMAADFLLFLRGELPPENLPEAALEWRAWSVLNLSRVPMFMRIAEKEVVAQQIVKVLKVPNITEFKKRLKERVPYLNQLFNNGYWRIPIGDEDIERIGTK